MASGKEGRAVRLLEYTVGEQQAGRTVKSIALRELRLSHSQFSSLKYRQGIPAFYKSSLPHR